MPENSCPLLRRAFCWAENTFAYLGIANQEARALYVYTHLCAQGQSHILHEHLHAYMSWILNFASSV